MRIPVAGGAITTAQLPYAMAPAAIAPAGDKLLLVWPTTPDGFISATFGRDGTVSTFAEQLIAPAAGDYAPT